MTSALSRIAIALLSTSLCFATGARAEQRNPFARIGHIVVIYTENRSFDHIFEVPGAEGLNSKNERFLQVGADGAPLQKLPKPPKDDRFPATLPNAPFALAPYVGLDAETKDDPVHDFYIEQEQIDGGRMDRFVEASNAGGLVIGHSMVRSSSNGRWRRSSRWPTTSFMRPSAAPSSIISIWSAPAPRIFPMRLRAL